MIALVTGATGCIGYALVNRLLCDGRYTEVRALVRPQSTDDLPSRVKRFCGTLEGDTEILDSACRGADVVFHAAAKVHDANGTLADFTRINIEGTRRLLTSCSSGKVSRFIFFSTVAVYGDFTSREGIPEYAPLNPQTPYAVSKVEAEKLVQLWGQQNTAVTASLRVATVYGARDRGNMQKMLHAIASNRFVCIGNGENLKTCAFVENVAGAALAVAETEGKRMNGHSFVVADRKPYSLHEIAETMQAALGKRKNILTIPLPIAYVLAYFSEKIAQMIHSHAPFTVKQVQRLTAQNIYQATMLQEITGYVPPVSLHEGIEAAVEWYRADRVKEQKQGRPQDDSQ